MSPIYVPGKVVLSRIQQYPAVLGEPWGGGYFAGYISHTADGNPTHALIAAPKATGATGTGYTSTTALAWKTSTVSTANTDSSFDGAANTAAMVTAGIADHPAANFCVGLNIGGFTDWYLPARYELDIAYFNLKPTTAANIGTTGINNYSVPLRTVVYTASSPAETYLSAFQSAGSESFSNVLHWSSTQFGASNAWRYRFSDSAELSTTKTILYAVRAFRRIAL